MKLSEFDYTLPKEFIAQKPVEPRHNARLMIVDRSKKTITHDHFYNLKHYLRQDDILVGNDTRVMAARLYGQKIATSAKVEILLLHQESREIWQALVKPAKRCKEGTEILFGGEKNEIRGKIIKELDNGLRLIQFKSDILKILDKIGITPLPPYIKEKLKKPDRYQTIYAKNLGSAAAPTAGLHFTPELIRELKKKGIRFEFVTLNIGLDTFKPIKEENIEDHEIHKEFCVLSKHVAEKLNRAKDDGSRIVAVGTTAARVLESACNQDGRFKEFKDWTGIYIYPGYQFKAVDALITNFHLPKSTLLLLVSAFADRELIMRAYEEAKANNYRFFSFGDAMFII